MVVKDEEKTREQLVSELLELRQWVRNLEDMYDRYEVAIKNLRSYEKALETMQIGVTITDLDGNILYINDADLKMHGYSRDEVIGRNVRIFAPSDDWEPMDKDEIKKMKRWSRESTNIRKDGSRFAVHLMSDIVTDEEGRIIGVVTTCEDITKRKKMEEEIRSRVTELEKFYRMSIGREVKMQELKREIKKLKEDHGKGLYRESGRSK
jgi:PAS domain S-box-containing protein